MFCLAEQKMPEGSWKCEKCNNINYPFRTKCNRQNCGADKPSEANNSPSEPADENDQVCCMICLFCISFCCVKLSLHLYITNSKSIHVHNTCLVNHILVYYPFQLFLICLTRIGCLCNFNFSIASTSGIY